MAVAVNECWSTTMQWLDSENSTSISMCRHMGHEFSIPIVNLFSHTIKNNNEATLPILSVLNENPNSDTEKEKEGSLLLLRLYLASFYLTLTSLIRSTFVPDLCRSSKDSDNVIFRSKIEYSQLGYSIVKGDFNGNGKLEIVIGAPGYSSQFSQNGAVFIIDPKKYSSGTYFVEDIHQSKIYGPTENGVHFGTSMAVVDLNQDGIDDLAISAPYVGFSQDTLDGKVFIRFGRKDLGLRDEGWDIIINGTISHPQSRYPRYFEDQHAVFGEYLFSSDIDGDGYDDLIIGSPSASVIRGSHQRGVVHTFYSSSNNSGYIMSSDADWILSGPKNYGWFGTSFEVLRKDGIMVIGSPGYMGAKGSKINGRIYGYTFPTSKAPNPSLLFTLESGEDYAQFGQRLVTGDYNSNGMTSLLVAAPSEVNNYID